MKKYFSREALDNIIKDQEGTIRFSTKPDSKSILIETDEQGSFEYNFEIQEEHKKYYLKDFEWHEGGNEPSENIICIDQYVANRKKGSRILLEKACFIYDKRENPLFVIGFDPHNGDAWQSSSTTGVSIKAEKLTHKFVKRNGDAAGFDCGHPG